MNNITDEQARQFLAACLNTTHQYGVTALEYAKQKTFDTFHANGTLHTGGDLLSPLVQRVRELLVTDKGFLGEKFAQFTKFVSENPDTFASRLIVLTTATYIAKRCFTTAWYPKERFNPRFGVMIKRQPPLLKRIPLYLVALGSATIAGYEVFSALSGRATCIEGFHDCVFPAFLGAKA
ncbi:MAG: hypothetical protein P0S96_07060 [Simkaniaceae bacterium]|nr:hypothetical protein [Candidatus Sacchlamyda saccharinae]